MVVLLANFREGTDSWRYFLSDGGVNIVSSLGGVNMLCILFVLTCYGVKLRLSELLKSLAFANLETAEPP